MPPAAVMWTVNPAHAGGVKGVARAWLRASLLHEFHHLVRLSTGHPRTLVDHAVFEGMATVLERDFAKVLPPWGAYPDNVNEWAQELLAQPGDASTREWLYVHPDGRRWVGIRVGSYWVERAMKASGRSAADLVVAPTSEILELAGATK